MAGQLGPLHPDRPALPPPLLLLLPPLPPVAAPTPLAAWSGSAGVRRGHAAPGHATCCGCTAGMRQGGRNCTTDWWLTCMHRAGGQGLYYRLVDVLQAWGAGIVLKTGGCAAGGCAAGVWCCCSQVCVLQTGGRRAGGRGHGLGGVGMGVGMGFSRISWTGV